ncbi:hypothetical protein [Halalkalicoccus salilacus]|uniref:hypothetical protein n=1 Tax=Halalkalicoccus sp. GCM10025704 TaxID=3252662 RepID=UPI003621055B
MPTTATTGPASRASAIVRAMQSSRTAFRRSRFGGENACSTALACETCARSSSAWTAGGSWGLQSYVRGEPTSTRIADRRASEPAIRQRTACRVARAVAESSRESSPLLGRSHAA